MSTYDEGFDELDRILEADDFDDDLDKILSDLDDDDLDGMPLDALYETEAESGLLYADASAIASAMADIASQEDSDD